MSGVCACLVTTCPLPDGGSVCTDTQTDSLNCNACGHPCAPGERCGSGSCHQCPAGSGYCPDSGLSCVDLADNDDDCGGCGIACGAGQHCAPADGGLGACFCNAGGTGTNVGLCDERCVDLASDPFDCGMCGNVCAFNVCIPGDAGTGVCECDAPLEWCGSTCVDPETDFDHCGGCTTPCFAPATQCVGGTCQ